MRQKIPAITLRQAELSDLPLLRLWDSQPHVRASNPNDPWDWESDLERPVEWRRQYLAELDGIPVGFVEILDPARDLFGYWGDIEDGYRAVDIWIGDERNLGQGYGTAIMRDVLDGCFSEPGETAVLVDPLSDNYRARRFYERLGFRLLETRRLGVDLCAVYRLEKSEYEGFD